MSVTTRSRPLLVEGDRLDSDEFLARYEQMPGIKAELIDGYVYIHGGGSMASPVGNRHGDAAGGVIGWLSAYRFRTPGVRESADPTVRLTKRRTPQPDAILRVLAEYGGQTRIEGGYIVGPPELVVEVSDSTKANDRVHKRRDYERGGVTEYVIFGLDPDEIYWHARRDGKLVELPVPADGIHRSESFPGLWLDVAAFWADDGPALLAPLERGLASPDHAAFVAKLRAARAGG
jgi:Uma2 family endonuclease